MAKYTCMQCGYVFDEEKGVAAGAVVPNYNAMLKTGCGWHKHAQQRAEVAPGYQLGGHPGKFLSAQAAVRIKTRLNNGEQMKKTKKACRIFGSGKKKYATIGAV